MVVSAVMSGSYACQWMPVSQPWTQAFKIGCHLPPTSASMLPSFVMAGLLMSAPSVALVDAACKMSCFSFSFVSRSSAAGAALLCLVPSMVVVGKLVAIEWRGER